MLDRRVLSIAILILIGCEEDEPTDPVIEPEPQGEVAGKVFVDRNRNGVLDTGEALGAFDLRLVSTDTMVETVTDASGQYRVFLTPGTYAIEPLPGSRDSLYAGDFTATVADGELRIVDLAFRYVRVEGNFIVAGETIELSAAEAAGVEVDPDGATLYLTGAAAELDVEAGDVLVVPSGGAHPAGLLRRVTGVVRTGVLSATLETEDVPLEEVLIEGEVGYSGEIELSAAAILIPGLPSEAPVVPMLTPEGLYYAIDDVLIYDHDGSSATTDDQIRVSGYIALSSVAVDIHHAIRGGAVHSAEWTLRTIHEAVLDVSWSLMSADITREKFLGAIPIGRFVIMAGIPIEVKLQMEVLIGASGEVDLGFTAGAGAELTTTTGFAYADGGISPIGTMTLDPFARPARVSAGLEADAYVRMPVVFLIYGIAGPYMGLRIAGDYSADLFADPWWEIGVRAETTVGFKGNGRFATVLKLPEFELAVRAGARVVVASSDGPFVNASPAVVIESPLAGASFTAEETIELRGSATDPEDGALSGSALRWESSRDGVIGSGALIATDALSLGAHVITLVATDSHGDEGTATVPITVSEIERLPDLVASSLSHTPASPDEGDDVTIAFTVDNDGEAASSAWSWRLSIDGVVVASDLEGPLAAGGRLTGNHPLPDVDPGAYALKLEVDFEDDVDEESEANNQASDAFTVSEEGGSGVGSLHVDTYTLGDNRDTDGYNLHLQGQIIAHMDPRDSRWFYNLAPGEYIVSLSDVESNCTVDPPANKIIEIVEDEATRVDFIVRCK